MIEHTLEAIGLAKDEAEIYLSLLENGPQSASQLDKSTSVKRTYVYALTKHLIHKNLILQKKVGKSAVFLANSPDKLLDLAKAELDHLQTATTDLNNKMADLKQKYLLVEEKPIVRVFEGTSGLKKAHMEVLHEHAEILAYVLIDKNLDKPLDDFWPKYYKYRKDHNIHVRSISPDNPEGKAYQAKDANQLRQTKLIKAADFPVTIEKNIVNDKVVFFSRDEEKLVATIIENKAIAETEKALFELHWKGVRG